MAGRGDASFAWELCKENVAPVARGRNVEKLNALLVKANSVELKASLAEMERSYEVQIKNAMSHDDPLETWVAYQKWTEENFPSDTAKNFTILERATRAFTADRRYRNDDRYLRFWIQYIDRIDKPIEVFKYLYKNKIGDKLALFYIAWALLLERKGDVKNAELIYAKGLQKKAEPFDALERKHSEFERRVSQKWLTSRDDDEDDTSQGRQALAPTAAPTIVVPVVPRRQPASTTVANASSFAIYSENDKAHANSSVLSENKSSAWKVLPSSKVINKENEQKPSIWTGAGLAPRAGHTPSSAYDEPTGPPVEIFVDETAATRASSRKRPHAGHDTGRALRPRLDDRSMTPAVLPSHDENPTQPSVSTKPDPSARKATKPATKRDILRVNIEMLKVPGQDDLCFEEVRAQRYWKAKAQAAAAVKALAAPVAASKPVRNGFLVDDTDDDVVQQAPAPQKWQPTVRTTMARGGVLAVTGAMHPLAAIADDAKYTQDDMTFNTRMAYEDIGSMFCSPTKAAPVVASPTQEQLTSFRKSNWVPKTEEPIVRKLHFSAFKAKPNGRDDDDDDDDESTPAVDANPAFLIFTEENDKSGPVVPHKKDPNRKALGDRNDIAKSTKKTNKDVLGFSLLPTTLGDR
ncbi:hypothetical protein SPRG_09746 [Saprolegnia parasitica CBS 223.65]|uniref:BUB1 N-terminal domain-containing protein n=1 Tax=Saprolegnia parasitica (strain CBS 223.65) TaxID=695850 RepID=A0A067CEM9_SAPPC|nr:hypothetical protein SPRG_09746 [Saprolegnia parasitica CBS 223.65]KDO25016.1 hypothetical protein SPRG_09746 [Saprolegnia parasitica CBS 223.65]|eukprot:XP_012204285.1 hypothetical protein SPRG_09746 [Saprolegnia parasitica CBS 223.65]